MERRSPGGRRTSAAGTGRGVAARLGSGHSGWCSGRGSRTRRGSAWRAALAAARSRWRAWSNRSAGARCDGRTGRCRSTGWFRLWRCRSCGSCHVSSRSRKKCRRPAGFDAGVDQFWERVKGSLALAVRRDSRYLNWKFIEPPHVRYQAAVLRRDDEVAGYVVYRHLREPQGRVTQIVDFLADPSDHRPSPRSRDGSIGKRAWRTPTRSAATPRMPNSADCSAVNGSSW